MFKLRASSAQDRRPGVVAVVVAFALVVLVGLVALSIDGGTLYLDLRDSRAAADAAAMAAACDLFKHYPTNNGTDPLGTAKQAALDAALANGYANDGVRTKVDVYIPPISGPYTGLNGYCEVIVTYNAPRAFSNVWGGGDVPVRARAVSRGGWVVPKPGVIILNYTDKAALNNQGNGAFTETGGPVIVNSNNPSAVLDSGGGTLIAQEFDITGGVQLGGGATFQTAPVPNQIFTGVHPTPDPLAYLPPPAIPPAGTMTITTNVGGGNTYVLTPGSYTNLPQFSQSDVVILQQASANSAGGIFYINGGGFKSTGASIYMDSTTTGGVMIYNAPASSSTSEKIQITGNSSGTVNLSPLTSGPYAGLVLWQDRTSAVGGLVEGAGNFTINGTFYFAGALLTINGNGKTSTGSSAGSYVDPITGLRVDGGSKIGSQYISDDLAIGGNGNINIKYAGPDLARTRIITLVE
jgi:hypothetical protein